MPAALRYTRALCRLPGPDAGAGLTTAALGPPDHARLLAQHAAYVAALRGRGLEVEVLPPLAGHPDAYFVEDPAVVVPELAVVTRPGAASRLGEAAALAPALARHRPLAVMAPPATLDGGDVLVVGRRVLVGRSERTSQAGVDALAALLAPHGYRVTAVPVGAGLHLKSSVNWVGGDALVVAADFAARDALDGFTLHLLDPAEGYAANVLWVNGALLHPAGFPRTRALLATLGLPLVELDTSEIRKMDGGLTCLSVRL